MKILEDIKIVNNGKNIIIYSTYSGDLFECNAVGEFIFNKLKNNLSEDEVFSTLKTEFNNIPEEQLLTDLNIFINQLKKEKIIECDDIKSIAATFNKALSGAFNLLKDMNIIGIEITRKCYVANALLVAGWDKKDSEIMKVLSETVASQQKDGGWCSISESLHCLQFLSHFRTTQSTEISKGFSWLYRMQNSDGGFGRSPRDKSRIPVTYLFVETAGLLNLEINDNIKRAIFWMEKEWSKDLNFGGLSYKCSGILIANYFYPNILSKDLVEKSVKWLKDNKTPNQGWGPNKDSPVKSIPSHTSLAIRALLSYVEKKDENIRQATEWLIQTQLPTGYWIEHPADSSVSEFIKIYNLLITQNENS